MKKIFLALVVAVISAIAVFSVSASAAEIVGTGSCGANLSWTIDSDGVLTITGTGPMNDYANGNATEWKDKTIYHVVIGDGVTTIGNNAFYGRSTIETVTFGNGLTSIGVSAFCKCENLIQVQIPHGVTVIGESAFYSCKNLVKAVIPDSVTKLGKSAFYYCLSLKSLKISNSLTAIEPSTFASCEVLASVEIPHGIKSIGTQAFGGCGSLKNVKLPASIESIGTKAFGKDSPGTGWTTNISTTQYNGNIFMWENIVIGKDNNLGTIQYTEAAPASVTLTYNANGGIEPPSPVTVEKGTPITISGEKLSRRNYEFLGWATSPAATSAEYTSGVSTITLNADITLYAVWKSTATFTTEIILRIDDKAAQVNGTTVMNDVAPIIENGRTMLPARFIAEKLGATVAWDDIARKVIITGADGTKIEIVLDSTTAYVNGVEHTLDSPAFIRDARTYTPVRFICDNLGANVGWDGVNRIVTITK